MKKKKKNKLNIKRTFSAKTIYFCYMYENIQLLIAIF